MHNLYVMIYGHLDVGMQDINKRTNTQQIYGFNIHVHV